VWERALWAAFSVSWAAGVGRLLVGLRAGSCADGFRGD
jgi:hypothetical protein